MGVDQAPGVVPVVAGGLTPVVTVAVFVCVAVSLDDEVSADFGRFPRM